MIRRLILLNDGTALVPVKSGRKILYSLIDAADVHLVDDRNWFVDARPHTTYARDRTGERLHNRLCPDADEVDHKDHDGLNNLRGNLRPLTGAATRRLQNANTRAHRDGKIGYKGVRADGKKFQARITVRGLRIALGRFPTAEDAARAYDRAAALHFPGIAYLNFGDAPAPANDTQEERKAAL